jgi:hypothetical protein
LAWLFVAGWKSLVYPYRSDQKKKSSKNGKKNTKQTRFVAIAAILFLSLSLSCQPKRLYVLPIMMDDWWW